MSYELYELHRPWRGRCGELLVQLEIGAFGELPEISRCRSKWLLDAIPELMGLGPSEDVAAEGRIVAMLDNAIASKLCRGLCRYHVIDIDVHPATFRKSLASALVRPIEKIGSIGNIVKSPDALKT